MPITRRRSLRLVIVTALVALVAALLVAPAGAAPAVSYRFWGFFQYTDGAWAFAQKGPAETVPADGSVEGWRFAVSGPDSSRYPRATATFDQLCAATPVQDGHKRVGVIVDFGRAADAEDGATPPEPLGTCAVLTTEGTSVDALQAVGEVRSDKGLICAVKGYPSTGCGGEVSKVSPEAAAEDTPVTLALPSPSAKATDAPTPAAAPQPAASDASTTLAGTWAAYGLVAVLIIALAILLVLRSRRARQQD
jgi:hypothetical protein